MKRLFLAMGIYALMLAYYQYQLYNEQTRRRSAEQALIAEMTRKPRKCPKGEYRWIEKQPFEQWLLSSKPQSDAASYRAGS